MPIRPTEATVDLAAVAHNFRLAVDLAGRPAMGIVKADAYGHGAVPVARALLAAGAPLLAVALVEEALELRDSGIEAPILVMSAAYGGRYDLLVRHRLTPIVFTPEQVARLADAARAAGVQAPAHLKIDTGMGRLGVAPADLPGVVEALRAAPEVELEGVCTHFACADVEPRETTERQVRLFHESSGALARAGFAPRLHHLANSAGTLEYPAAHQDLTRPGIMIYGYSPFEDAARLSASARRAVEALRPALTWRTGVVHVKSVAAGSAISYGGRWVARRPSRIATIPVGYGDGYPRRLSGRPGFGSADALLRGQRVPVAGTVCMDMTMLDVTDVPGVEIGDEVVLIGAQDGARIGADELAAKLGTISYEVLCGIGKRVPRRYSQTTPV